MIEPRGRFRRALLQLQEFVRWVLKSEDLPPSNLDRSASPRALQVLAWLLAREQLQEVGTPARQFQETLRWLLKAEGLPPSNPDRRSSPQALKALAWLLGRERLQRVEKGARVGERSFLGWLVTPEVQLKDLPESGPAERNSQRWLLAAEQLPKLPRPDPEKSFLAYLFARESLPSPKTFESKLEVVQHEP